MKKLNRLLPDKLEDYVETFTSPLNPFLQQILDHTLRTHAHPNMISSHVTGKLLSMLSRLVKPERILEIGTFTGFSALCLAEGLTENGLLYTIDLREEDLITARANFEKSEHKSKIRSLIGDARTIIPTLDERWDMVFIDADKVSYIEYYELTLPKLSQNGIILADNVLFHGDVAATPIKGKNAKAMHAFNEYVAKDERTEQVMLSIRDGISIIRKTK